jgi:hypothetical protein
LVIYYSSYQRYIVTNVEIKSTTFNAGNARHDKSS